MIICPKCGNDGSIAKVSAIWARETGIVTTSGPTTGIGMTSNGSPAFVVGTTSQSGISQSILAKKLAPPQMPTKKANSCIWYGLGLIFPLFFLFAHTPKWTKIVIGVLFIIIGILAAINGGGNADYIGYIAFPASAAIYILGFIGLSKGSDRQKKELEEKMDSWHREYAEWNKLYYCSKHDYVFTPSESE